MRRRIHLSVAGIFLVLLQGPAPRASDATLASDTNEAAAGFYTLSWSAGEPARLVESLRADFATARVVYAGEDTSRVISGKPNGEWHYRLESQATGKPLTPVVRVTVRHHSLARAWSFFGLGGVVFIATWALIVLGNRAAQQGKSASGRS